MCELNPPRDRNRCLDLLINTINLKELINIKRFHRYFFFFAFCAPPLLPASALAAAPFEALPLALPAAESLLLEAFLLDFVDALSFSFFLEGDPFPFVDPSAVAV